MVKLNLYFLITYHTRTMSRTISRTMPREPPSSIYELFMHFLDFRSVANLSAVSRTARAGSKLGKQFVFGNVRLSLAQLAVRDAALAMRATAYTTPMFVLRAPMGFGKTIIGLSIALSVPAAGNRYLIVVPPATYDTWVNEADKVFGGVRAYTPRTTLLFANSSIPKHAAVLPPAAQAIPKQARTVVVSSSSRNLDVFVEWATRIIIDEAHAITSSVRTQLVGKWAVALSANIVDPSPWTLWRHGSDEKASWSFETGVMKGIIPEGAVRYVTVPPLGFEARSYVLPHDKKSAIDQNLHEYVAALKSVFCQIITGRVVLYLPDGTAADSLIASVGEFAPGWSSVVFSKAVSKIRLFEQKNRCILFMHHAHAIGINISAHYLISARVDWVNPIRYSQLVGRVLRPTRAASVIDVVLIIPSGLSELRARYAEAIRSAAVSGLVIDTPKDLKALVHLMANAALEACGSSTRAASPAEILAAAGIGFILPEYVTPLRRLWSGGNQTITERQLERLLGIPELTETEKLMEESVDDLLEELGI